ncbi:MAG: UDP-N-acetylglucosamine 2-epimerase (non-hydrolyzing) [Candidatus Methanoperedens sp.]|nr:UDP-N-acetylglucosamine 2-epimerase (non-hydrolyzing) [Candidatus Methanoperedens sp.]MCZ7396188.1 UDP-N-acetylglucosamine 2-epimerase (non-hydrolyzing) [Candidatus Methanoperedens sp.]
MSLAIILGTRPEIIKMSPVMRECERRSLDYFILHTGQHYSYSMDRVFFEQLELPEAKYNLEVGSGEHGEQTGRMMAGIEKVLIKEKPDAVMVQGDTNTVLAGALAASKLGITVGHVEAGLRSYDRRMPEELNRVLADHASGYLFAPTEKSREILLHEGIPEEKIFVTGNTIVDAVHQNLRLAKEKSILEKLNVEPNEYFLLTAHRQENVDDPARFTAMLKGIEKLSHEFDIPVIYPIHPRSRKRMEEFKIRTNGYIRLIEPLDFLDFLKLESNARLVLTDSGGVQEETCILGVPCVTLRDNTERPETVEVGSNMLAGVEPERVVECARSMLAKGNGWRNPFGDGKAAERIGRVMAGRISDDEF